MASPSSYRYLPPDLAEALRQFGISVRRPVQGLRQGQHRSPHFGSSVEFAEYREYTDGDPIALIDWSVYARSDRYVIRRYHEETNLRAYVLLDTSGSMAFHDEGRVAKISYACSLAAGFMHVLINQGDSVGLMLMDRTVHTAFEPVQTPEGLRPLLLGLEQFSANGTGDIEAAIHEAANRLPGKSLVILISDLLQPPEQIRRAIHHLWHDGHNVIVLHVLDPGERRLTLGGVAEFRDMETGSRITVEVDEIRDAYRDAVETYIEELRDACAGCMADYHVADTRTPVQVQLTNLLEPRIFS